MRTIWAASSRWTGSSVSPAVWTCSFARSVPSIVSTAGIPAVGNKARGPAGPDQADRDARFA